MKKTLLLIPIALIALFSLALASCGSGSSDTTTPTTSAATTVVTTVTTTTTPTPTTVAIPQVGELKIGSILPETGDLAFLGAPMIQGFGLAVTEINDANAGITVLEFTGDSGTDPAVAGNVADSHIVDGVSAIVGAAASGISLSIIDKVTSQDIVMISPSNTSPTFTGYADNGYYFRTAPSDTLQGQLLAELVIDGGSTLVTIIHRADDYGRELAKAARSSLESSGASVGRVIEYDPNSPSFAAEAQQAADSSAEAVILIGFAEGTKVLGALIEANFGPADVKTFITDGLAVEDLGERVDPSNPGVVSGITGVAPSATPAAGEATFQSRLQAYAPSLNDLIFSSHTYDAVVTVALAAMQAGSSDSTAIRDNINDVTRGGTKCSLFAECAQLVRDGEDIDYDGASGLLEFTDIGEPSSGVYAIYKYGAGGVRTIEGEQTLS